MSKAQGWGLEWRPEKEAARRGAQVVLTQAFHGRSCDLPGHCDQLVPTAKAGSNAELMPWG